MVVGAKNIQNKSEQNTSGKSLLVYRLILCFEVLMIIGLVIALIGLNGTRNQSNGLGDETKQETTEIGCEGPDYKKYNDRVFYGDWLGEAKNSGYFDIITSAIEAVRSDPEVKVVIDDVQGSSDDVVIKGYQIVDGVLLADTWFAVSADVEEAASSFDSLFVSPDMVSKDGLINADVAVDTARFALEGEAENNRQAAKYLSEECSYTLEYSYEASLENESGYYFDVRFGRSSVKIDAITNRLVDLYIHPEVVF